MNYIHNFASRITNARDTRIMAPQTECIYKCGRILNNETHYVRRMVQTDLMRAPAFYHSCVRCYDENCR